MPRAKRPAPAARGKPLATLDPNVASPAKQADDSNKRRKIDHTPNVKQITKEAPRSSSRRRSGPYAATTASRTQDENAIDFSLLRGKQTTKAPNAPSVPATPSALLRSRFAPRRDSAASQLANFVPRQRPRSVLGIRTNDREDSLAADDSLAIGLLSSPPLSSPPRSIAALTEESVVQNLISKDLPSDLAHSDDESISLPSLTRSPELEIEPVDESILAPPASTSSSAPSPVPQTKSRNARGGQRKTQPRVKQLATNDLKAMLPKRLRRPLRKEVEHHDSLSVPEFSDADELSLPLSKQRKKPNAKAARKGDKPTKTNASASKKRTYERRSLDAEESDEEASEAESISSESPPHARGRRATSKAATAAQTVENAALKEEMKKMRAKFAKVDEFELEFESFTGSSSSPMAR